LALLVSERCGSTPLIAILDLNRWSRLRREKAVDEPMWWFGECYLIRTASVLPDIEMPAAVDCTHGDHVATAAAHVEAGPELAHAVFQVYAWVREIDVLARGGKDSLCSRQ